VEIKVANLGNNTHSKAAELLLSPELKSTRNTCTFKPRRGTGHGKDKEGNARLTGGFSSAQDFVVYLSAIIKSVRKFPRGPMPVWSPALLL
jgi:hypothetical protein